MRYRTLCLLLVAIGANWFWSVPLRGQTNQDPDFTNENDILHGNRTLYQVTDVEVLAFTSQGQISLYDLKTSNSTPGTPTTLIPEVISQTGMRPFNFSGRMFNVPGAVTVTAATGSAANLIYSIQYPGPNSGDFYQANNGILSLDQALTNGVTADFNRDGYDDLVLGFNNGAISVATAVDVNAPSGGIPGPLHFGPTARVEALSAMAAGDFAGKDTERSLVSRFRRAAG